MPLSMPAVPVDQALRYLGVKGPPPKDLLEETQQICGRLQDLCRPRYACRRVRLERPGLPVLAPWGLKLPGEDMSSLLKDCAGCVVFALTLGEEPEAWMRRAALSSAAKALVIDACASAACEAACDLLQNQLEARFCAPEGLFATDRFSPGYGDLPLSVQPALLELLDAQRQCGLTLTESCMMIPRKSVTAVFGLADRPQGKRAQGCGVCALRQNCSYRKAGITCG